MGLGGYLAARNDADHYGAERQRETQETIDMPEAEKAEVRAVFRTYGLTDEQSKPLVEAIASRKDAWVDFMMRFELGLEAPDPRRALASALTIAGAYVAGGLVPLLPYMLIPRASRALPVSAALTAAALLVFGFVKARFTGAPPGRSALQTALVGGLAAAAAFGLAKLLG